MKLVSEITKALNHINSQTKLSDIGSKKEQSEINLKIQCVMSDFESHNFDFSKTSSIILKQGSKQRFAKRYVDKYSTENILCQCIKQILDRNFKIKYPNRNKISRALFNSVGAIKHMSDFTVVKFDFKDYFNSISSVYVYEKIIKIDVTDRFENDLVSKFCSDTKYAYAGLHTSNVIAEIIGKLFDDEILMHFSSHGLIFYERYIDDGIIVLNEFLSEKECKDKISNAIDVVFYDSLINVVHKCTTKMNIQKFKYISKRQMSTQKISVDFLGYDFIFTKNAHKVEIMYGITDAKRVKYKKRIKNIIELFHEKDSSDYGKIELLRHRILAFSCREVYMSKKFKSDIWKVKGFISNYGELRYLLGTGLVDVNTERFLLDVIFDCFRELGVDLPYFLKGNGKNAYSLYWNMLKNKTLLFESRIGYSDSALSNLCAKVDIPVTDSLGHKRGYGTMVRDYLIKTKVGY